jgi:hypothetical protein
MESMMTAARPVQVAPTPPPLRRAKTQTSAITIAMVKDSRVRSCVDLVVAHLAELAVNDELIIVFGSDRPETNLHPTVAALRERLPRFTVVPLYVANLTGPNRCDADLVGGLLDDGSLPIILAPAVAAPSVAANLYHHLRADRMIEMSMS